MKVVGLDVTKYTVALSAIVVVGAVLRIYQLGAQSLWFDEAFSVWVSKMDVPQLIQVTATDTHPPFYFLILHYWIVAFGSSEFAVRLLSALCGILALPLIYLVGRQLFDKEAGLVAALILTLSSFNVQYSQEARMYTLMVLLALVSTYCFLRLFRHHGVALSVGYVLSTTLMLYTHLYGWFVLVAQNVYVITLLVLSKDRAVGTKRWVVLQTAVIALFIPWIPFLMRQTETVLTGQPTAIFIAFAAAPPTAGSVIQTLTTYAGSALLLALFIGLSALSLFAHKKAQGPMNWKAPLEAFKTYSWDVRVENIAAVWFLALCIGTVNILPFVISQVSVSIYFYRYTIAASVALYTLVAAGIRNITHTYAKLAVIGVVVVLSAAPLQTYYNTLTKQQGQEAFSFVDTNARSGDAGLIFPVYHRVIADYYNKRTDVAFTSFGATQRSVDENCKELNASLTGSERVWFVCADYGRTNAQTTQILKTLNESYESASFAHFAGYNVYLFVKRG